MKEGLIVEDHPESRERLAMALVDAYPGMRVSRTVSAAEAAAALSNTAFDVALVDLGLPDGRGVDVIAAIAENSPATLIVVASIHGDDAHLFPALQSGAQGYLLKDQTHEQLVARLSGIRDGQPPLSPAIARRLLRHFQAPALAAGSEPLTARELEALKLLGKGIKIADIAAAMGITRHTAADHVKAIYRKLRISSRAEAALRAQRMGLLG